MLREGGNAIEQVSELRKAGAVEVSMEEVGAGAGAGVEIGRAHV